MLFSSGIPLRKHGESNRKWGTKPLPTLALLLVELTACDERDSFNQVAAPSSNQQITAPPADASPAPNMMVPEDPPQVDLSGTAASLAIAAVEKGSRIYSRDLRLWVREEANPSSRRLGYLRAGSSSPTTPHPVGHSGCKGGWYPVIPRGFVCLDGRATLDGSDSIVQLYEQNPPRTDKRLPYRYGTVRKPGPVFGRQPSLSDLKEAEPDFERRFPEWLSLEGDSGASFRQDVWEWGETPPDPIQAWEAKLTKGVPDLLKSGALLPSPTGTPRPKTLILDRMDSRVGHSFLDTFFSEGRRYGLTTHLELVPTDRYRPLVGSAFHGVEIGKDLHFPIAFVRRVGAKFTDGTLARYQNVLKLTGKRKFVGDRLHYETEHGKWISDQFASELTLAKNMPGWAKKGEKWISVSINKQTLVLYEGENPVFATLVSTGEAGLDSADETTATKRGIFRVHTKHITATMASDEVGEEFELRDVPYVQYFAEGGFALHGAYWHDNFGTPKSHGCINLAPEDARRIFYWTDPPVPRGWHGALLPLRGTVVFVHP